MSMLNLGGLSNPLTTVSALSISGESLVECRRFLFLMNLIRTVENRLAMARRDGLVGGPVHLGVGQEAIAVGMSASLRSTDRIFGAHRSHAHLLALGSSVQRLFAEVLGKDTGHSRGMGGSMHLWDQSRGFYGSVPIVAGTVALAVGAGLAAKLQCSEDVAVTYLGDGAVEEGVVHESLNLARIKNLPVLFVVENNLFASHMYITSRQPSDSTARFAAANGVPFEVVDGNDVIKIAQVGREAIARARSGGGPFFIEAVTYRWYGHVDWRDDIDVGVNRSKADVDNWKARDPIARLRCAMVNAGVWSADQDLVLQSRIAQEVDDAWEQAMRDPYPSEEALLDRVYFNGGGKS